jgi:phage FluMu protein Com
MAKRARGRPPGSQNVRRTLIYAQAVRCPRCQGTDTVDRRLISRSYRPGTAFGHPFTHVSRYALRCRQCNAQLEAIFHEYIIERRPNRKPRLF